MTVEQAKERVRRKYPGYVIEWCVLYKNTYIVMAHPDDGPENNIQGAYPDPFYSVSKLTGRISRFIPAAENDFGQAFFDAVDAQLRG